MCRRLETSATNSKCTLGTKIKEYLFGLWALVTAAFAVLFFYERNKAQVSEALSNESSLNVQLAKQDGQIETNNALLKVEEDKRAALAAGVNTNASPDDIAKYFNSKPE